MREMSNKGGWILPEVIDPPTRCISINVPDDPAHVAAFWGALWELAHWSNWQRDEDHLGKDVAEIWKRQWIEAVNQDGCEGEGCIMDVRQNTENPCTLEKTLDGITWEPFANLKLCPPTLRRLGNNIQYSTDGIGWFTVPDGDYTPGYDDPGPGPRPPAPEGQDQCCLASANAENAIYLTYAALSPEWPVIPGLEAILGADIANLLHILIGPLYDAFQFGAQLLTAFIAGVIFDVGGYTEEIRDELRVIICEHITVTENVPDIDFEAVQTEVGSMGGGVWAGINTILFMIGPSGLNLAASTTALTEADCGDCGCPAPSWCVNWVFSETFEALEVWNGTLTSEGVSNTHSVFVGGRNGYRSSVNAFATLATGSRVTGFTFEVIRTGTPDGWDTSGGMYALDGQSPDVANNGTNADGSMSLFVDCSSLNWDGAFQLQFGGDGANSGDTVTTRLTVTGTGEIPIEWVDVPIC